MKKTKDRHINDQAVKRHTKRCSCFKRAGVLLLCMLVWLTSDPSIMDAFTVRAEEENNLKCVITSFLPLSEEIAQQSVCVGTPMEELLLPDTLEAVCTYKDDQESSSDDIEKEDSGEEEKTPEKPKPEDQIPSESEEGDETPEEPKQGDQSPTESENSDQTSPEPGDGDQTPGEPENGDQTSPEPGNGDQTPAEPEDGDQTPKAPEEGDGTAETSDANGNMPETPEQGGSTSDKTDPTTGESEQGGQNVEESVSDMGGNADGSDANTVYVDKLESMISAVRDKAFSLLGGVSIEETQVTMETNLTEPEEEADIQVLTNIVTINPVTWEGIFEYDSELAGCYIFTPVLPEGFLLADDVALPEIVVIVMNEEAETSTAKTQAISVQAAAATSGTCGASLTWEYADGTLKIRGSGAMDNFDIAPWNEYASEINNVSIDEGVTTIGNYAFFDCDSLGSVNLPGNITSIGTAAFFGCSSLGPVAIPYGVKSIGSLAFNGCSNLGIVEIPDSVESITAYTFRNCSNAIIYYPASLSGLGDTKDTKANISYTVDGNLTTLKIVSVGANVSAIHFPETIGGAEVGAANWNEYEGKIKITHDSFLEHRYTDSSECTICGEQKAPEIKIDFLREKLIGFEQGKTYTYSIAGTSGTLSNSTELDIKDNWFGKEISIALQNAGSSTGKTQVLLIPIRPVGPTGITTSNVTSKGNDGKLHNVSSKMEYWQKGASPEVIVGITGDTVENLPAGTYCVRFKAVENTSFSSQIVEVVIGEYEPGREEKPTAKIDYVNESLIGLVPGDSYHIVCGTAKADMTAKTDGSIPFPSDESWFGKEITIVKKGKSPDTIDSEAFKLDIPARPKGPTGITTSNVTSKGNDGKLLNVSSKMEYWQKGASPQKVVEITGETVENLPAGTYCVRFKAVENTSFSSQAVEVVIGEYVPEPEKKPEAEIDYIDEKLIGLIGGETYHISIGATDEDVTVRADGNIAFPSDDSWLGKLITIVKKGKKPDTRDSEAQVVKIGIRPKAPSNIKTTPATAGQSDGTLSGGTADKDKLEYRVSGTGSWIPITGSTQTGLTAGKYDVRFRASNTEKKFASESVTVTVSYAVMTQEPTPTVSINFKDEQLTGLKFGDEYLIDNTEITVEDGGVLELSEDWFDTTINIVKAGDGIKTTDSEAFELYIPARPSAPADVETEDISVKDAKDGKLLNLRDTMEYRPENSEKWIPVPNNSTQVTGLAAGVYFVRIKATDSSFCSEEVELIIMDFELKAEATPEAQIDYEEEELTGLIKGTYLISTDDTESSSVDTVKVGTDERIVIKDKWFGSTLYIVRKGNGYTTENSEAQQLDIPERRDAPNDIVTEKETKKGAKDGKLTNVNNSMLYQKKGAKDWTAVDGDEVGPLAPGVYLVCYKAVIGQDFRSEIAEYSISAFELSPADTPDLVDISYEDEYFMYLTPYADYKIGGVTVSADADGKIKIRDAWMKNKEVSIIQLGDGLTTDKSAPFRIKVPSRHSSPGSVKAVSESAEDANDGKLIGVNDKMEYRVADSVEDSEANWIQIDSDTNTVENLEPAKYKIRYMATDNSFASKSVTKTVYAYGAEPKTPDKSKGDSAEEEIPTDENSDSSQTEDGSAGGGTAGNAGSVSTGGANKNALADGTDAAAIEENTDESGADTISQNTLTGQNAETGSGSNSDNDQENKSNKGNAGKTEPADGASENDAGLTQSESGSLAETAGDGEAIVYTERTADRMSAFYDFLLRLADSRNLGWIAIILAEPILFLLLLIYLLSRKKRDAECQTEN